MKVKYACETCGQSFDNEKECIACENKHLSMKYKVIDWTEYGRPLRIAIHCEDGEIFYYQYYDCHYERDRT